MQCLMRGIAGDPVVDLDDNGHVDLDELAAYTARYMAFAAEGKPMFTTTGDFNPKLRLADTNDQKRQRVGELLEVWSGTKWAKAEILDVRAQQVQNPFHREYEVGERRVGRAGPFAPFRFPTFSHRRRGRCPGQFRPSMAFRQGAGELGVTPFVSKRRSFVGLRRMVRSQPHGASPVGTWSGKWKNDLGESGPESLVLQAEGNRLGGTWSGNVKFKGERLGKDNFYFEGATQDRFYRCAGRIEGACLVLDYCAHRAQGDGHYYGWSNLVRQGAVADAPRDPRSEFSGSWTGTYENSRGGSGAETLELSENAGILQGVWSGVRVTGERLGNSSFYLEGKLGQRTYRVIGRVAEGRLVLNYSAVAEEEQYVGWSMLKR